MRRRDEQREQQRCQMHLDGKSRVSALSTSSFSVSSFWTMNCARSPTTCIPEW